MVHRWIRVQVAVVLLSGVVFGADAFPGKQSTWHGFARYDFVHAERKCIVVAPEMAAPGRPWVWRARFFGHEPQTDVALLKQGFHLAYMDVGGLFGAPSAVTLWDDFYQFLTGEYGFSAKVALEGMSRGGLIIFNWAASNSEKVSCIYADAPVCDFRSWPGGKGQGSGSAGDWQQCLKVYGLTEEQGLVYARNPIDNLASLAAAGVPLLHVCGAADKVVPVAENTQIIKEHYEKLGGKIEVILKPDCGHHPHSLKDPKRIVDFILKNTPERQAMKNDIEMAMLANPRARFLSDKQGRVAFLGGSITQMEGYRPLVCADLQRRFPDTDFDFIDAGVSSTCSTTGAFRLATDVFRRGRVDLLFVEFAVNDNQDARHTPAECIRGMEGIVRHARRENPAIGIVFLYCANESHIRDYSSGKVPEEIAAHQKVAAHYGIPGINFAQRVAAAIDAGDFDWKTFGGCHPSPFGNRLYGDWIAALLDSAWLPGQEVAPTVVSAVALPEKLDAAAYASGGYLDLSQQSLVEGWSYTVPEWASIPGQKRSLFTQAKQLHCETPGITQEIAFDGTAIGLYVVAGPDAGRVEYSVDGGPFKDAELYHHHSANLHYPRTVMLADGLSGGRHTVALRLAATHHPKSTGTAARIVQICVNGGK